ncbi:LacI family DNA-binding transcriptional regulator [Francisella sp. 19X1-34]|uniref:LacI family DNA-binding transcriptional regulator n=1 Tax=Francisella sp. 19X1-34 TaxID=3087177 RepID=UPI002E32D3C4|nr:LacI family DNA-binding transcriptional regulator [Francisella sp. 19X1-34]MED7789470.1 LacI family DNA-binding transcriptional regulator [Francisella sp. 19X1-34]
MITQKDIANRLNISRTTVYRALLDHDNINHKTKQKVLSLVKELGYTKNLIGSSLARKNAKKVYAFIIKSHNENYSVEIKKGLIDGYEELKNYNLSINIIETSIDEPEDQIYQLKKIIEEELPDGIIIIPQLKNQIEQIIKDNPKIKFIALDSPINKDIDYIGSDYIKAGKISANILAPLLRNNEKVLILKTKSDEISSNDYLMGFYLEAKAQNLNIVGPIFIENILESIDLIINKYLKEDVVAIYSNRHLSEIIKVITNRLPNIKLFAVTRGMNTNIHDLISRGKILATVRENHIRQSYLAAKKIFSLLHGTIEDNDEISKQQTIGSKIIFKSNLDEEV